MTRAALIREIGGLLRLHMNVPEEVTLDETTHLNHDIYVDSVMVLELLVRLEIELGFSIPDEAPAREHFTTLGTLAEFLLGLSRDGRQPP
jgi:aryl carrier protein AsbD